MKMETQITKQIRFNLRKEISATGFFSLAFGSMIGVAWVTALGWYISQAGPLGSIIAFTIGGILMFFIGLCYAEVTSMLPLAGGEVAYAYKAFGTSKSFIIGWFLAFGYLSVSAFEAISIGKVLGFMLPDIDNLKLYAIGGEGVYAPHLILALICTSLITFVNYVGVKHAANLQTALTFAFIAITLIFILVGIIGGSPENLHPVFSRTNGRGIIGSIMVVLVTIPFWFVGFDTISQGAEEAKAGINPKKLGILILTAIAGATLFYITLTFSVSSAGPWQKIVDYDLPTAKAFELAFQSKFLVQLVLIAALIGLFTSWNGFLLAGSRVLFALGRGRILPAWFGITHKNFGTPANAVLFSGIISFLAALLGRGAMIAFLNVGSFCIGIAFLGVALSTIRLRRTYPSLDRPYRMPGGLITAFIAAIGSGFILAAMLIPGSPAVLAWPIEWIILISFVILGVLFWIRGSRIRNAITEEKRSSLILEEYVD